MFASYMKQLVYMCTFKSAELPRMFEQYGFQRHPLLSDQPETTHQILLETCYELRSV